MKFTTRHGSGEVHDGSDEETDGSREETNGSDEVDDRSGEDEARSRVRVRDCASVGQRWLQRPPESEKKRGSRRRERRASRRRGDADSPREESEAREDRVRRRCGGELRARRLTD